MIGKNPLVVLIALAIVVAEDLVFALFPYQPTDNETPSVRLLLMSGDKMASRRCGRRRGNGSRHHHVLRVFLSSGPVYPTICDQSNRPSPTSTRDISASTRDISAPLSGFPQ